LKKKDICRKSLLFFKPIKPMTAKKLSYVCVCGHGLCKKLKPIKPKITQGVLNGT